VNLRPGQQDAALVQEFAGWAHVIKLSEEEAPAAAEFLEIAYAGPRPFLEELAARYKLEAACLTRGKAGCLIQARGGLAECPGVPVDQADPVGAGDAFAAAFLHGFGHGWSAEETGRFANRVGALVASRPGATPPWNLADLDASD
jgi:fructokinase